MQGEAKRFPKSHKESPRQEQDWNLSKLKSPNVTLLKRFHA